MLSIRAIATTAELDELRRPWDELLESTESGSPFQSHEWLSTWWKHFGEGRKLLVLAIQDGDTITGIAPLCLRRIARGPAPLWKVEFLGSGLSDQLDFIVPERQREHLELVVSYLRRPEVPWTVIDLHDLPVASGNADLFEEALRRSGLAPEASRHSICPYVKIASDWESFFLGQFSGGTRWQIRKKPKKLAKLGPTRIEHVVEIDDPSRILRSLSEMPESDVYRGTRRRCIFKELATNAFFGEVATLFSRKGWMHLSLLELSGALIAYRFGFRHRGVHYDYFHAYDPAFASCGPGAILMTDLIRRSFESGLREFNFLRGEEPYKFEWTERFHTNLRITCYEPSVRGELLRWMNRARQWRSDRREG